MRGLVNTIALATASHVASMAVAMNRRAKSHASRIFGHDNIRRALQQQKRDHLRGADGSIAYCNRWGGPHYHEREIARRARQKAKANGLG